MTTHMLYRFFDDDGALLYVGRTINPRQRWSAHARHKDWFERVAEIKREILPDAESLDLAERRAIATEFPRHNVALNRRPKAQAPLLTKRDDRLLYRYDEAAERLGVTRFDLERLIADGEIDTIKIGRRRLVPSEALTEYVARVKAAS